VALAALGLLAAAWVTLRAACCVGREIVRARRERRAHAAFLAVAGSFRPSLGALILDQDEPAVYCLPSGRHRVVISAGAIESLSPEQLRAVLAHERGHLRARHHLMVTVAAGLARAFPYVPLLAGAQAEIPLLAEMAADDSAIQRNDPGDLAAALVILARARSRAAALTAGGTATTARIHRLLAAPPCGWPAKAGKVAAGVAAFMLPAGIAILPLLAAGCGVPGH
ncbi:MAG: M56 family metallopeptidase, partial [Nocardiopsaceae bacterium]|jgi:Zn-dependent protease with chaperone function|nr:M56 family metallopeptidase [Nocardiopsaceae bacterium]